MEGIVCAQFVFYNDFDSANLARVEYVPPNESTLIKQSPNKSINQEVYDAEFNIWTKPDCCGTEFENGNRTWFYFGMKAPGPALYVRFNMVDLNRQGKMYSQGMAPVFRIMPGKPKWERINDKPVYSLNNDIFTLTFKFRTPENPLSTMYFAFTYPFSYVELEKMMVNIDQRYLNMHPYTEDDIYYVRETMCHSLEGRTIDLITISSYHGITGEREPRLKNLFTNEKVPRPQKFMGKKVIFISARVHPGETPSSFVFNGLLNLLLQREDLIAQHLRRLYVFKMIPFLNPDGVARGHYRTDTRGVNLNRVYLNPSLFEHPSVYAARALIRYYHFGFEKEDYVPKCNNCTDRGNQTDGNMTEDNENQQNENIREKVSHMTLEEGDGPSTSWCTKCKNSILKLEDTMPGISSIIPTFNLNTSIGHNFCRNCGAALHHTKSKEEVNFEKVVIGAHGDVNSNESNLFLYLDMHGHASKKGIFMYGNHFDDMERNVECMLLPKLMSINNHNFHFNACNFTERNMYLRDKRDGMSRAGSGRVAVLSLTGIIKSYTLECNYNTGRIVNVLPPTIREPSGKVHTLPVPPKYSPQVFEEVGKSLGASILDLTGQNPCSRLPNSEFHSLSGLRDWLRSMSNEFHCHNRPKMRARSNIVGLQSQGKSTRGVVIKNRPPVIKPALKKPLKQRGASLPLDRKENLAQPGSSKSGSRLNKCFKVKSRKDLTLKSKNTAAEKITKSTITRNKKVSNIVTTQKVRLDITSKLQTIREGTDKPKTDTDSIHLREICFIKNNEGKTVIAKYQNKDNATFDDNLVVSWSAVNSKPQIFTQKTRIASAPPYPCGKVFMSEPGTSKQSNFRVHNFTKSSSKTKLKKHPLRRLASATDALGKIDKSKKKKLKAK
ncbi:cytosolic carboxypeptidase-like protein 5 isoform X2 [Anoplophora glabripennis]|uniref:cytosolic carboxypeptidase-like protein 5 isoform X2 n=1 Tax=Anoplophora glabripennis TaxID=217634 RepID=UPI0008759D2C|nr:cytosolic carboxypeptidase-like protein 5 isoform X2 [Anoplophora glabripennis]